MDSVTESGNMFDLLSDDVVRRIYRNLEAKPRGRLACVNRSLANLFRTWDDVLYCSMRNDGVSLGGDRFVFETLTTSRCNLEDQLPKIVRRCPCIRKLAVHDGRLMLHIEESDVRSLVNIDELHLSSDILTSTIEKGTNVKVLLSLPKLRKIHIQQRYCNEKSEKAVFREEHARSITSQLVYDIKLQGVAVPVEAMEVLSNKFGTTLEILCLIGSLMHTCDSDEHFAAINRFEKLCSLSIPPSLYSISGRNKDYFKGEYPSLRDLCSLRSVAVLVTGPDLEELKKFVHAILPAHVEHIVLFDESYRLEMSVKEDLKDLKHKLHFCDDNEVIVDSFWMNDRSELITKTLWKPPYKPNIVIHSILPEWYCVVCEFMDTAISVERSSRTTSSTSTQTNNTESITVSTAVELARNVLSEAQTTLELHTARGSATHIEIRERSTLSAESGGTSNSSESTSTSSVVH